MSDYNERHKEEYNPILLSLQFCTQYDLVRTICIVSIRSLKNMIEKLQHTDRQVILRDTQTTQTKIDHKDRQTYKMDVDQ